jgi:hypothetical protein
MPARCRVDLTEIEVLAAEAALMYALAYQLETDDAALERVLDKVRSAHAGKFQHATATSHSPAHPAREGIPTTPCPAEAGEGDTA